MNLTFKTFHYKENQNNSKKKTKKNNDQLNKSDYSVK